VIRQVERFHGVALARLIRSEGSAVSVARHPRCRAAYTIDDRVAVYVKYSTNRLSPWAFGFKQEHQAEIADLRAEFNEVFVALVCGTDGIACLGSREYQRVLDDVLHSSEWVRVARGRREKYAVTGSDGRKAVRIGDNEYPAKVLAAVGDTSDIS
jgi:hypothetical protein